LLRAISQPVVEAVDRDHPLGAEQHGAGDRELADRAGAPDGDRPRRPDVAHLGAHVAGREDVRQEQHLLVGQVVLDLDRADVGERHARVLGLAAGVAAGQVRVAEDAGGRVAEHLLGHPGVRVGVLAERVQLVLAGQQLPQAIGNGTTTRSPTFRFVTPLPTRRPRP
jgi:hypothetical protein